MPSLLVANDAVTPEPAPETAPAALADVGRSPQSPIGAAVAGAVEPSAGLAGAPAAEAVNKVTATWAGDVDGGKATIAIAVEGRRRDRVRLRRQRVEAWLQGTAVDGKLDADREEGDSSPARSPTAGAKGTVNVGRQDLDVRRRRGEDAVRPLPRRRQRAQRRGGQRLDRADDGQGRGHPVAANRRRRRRSTRRPELDLATGHGDAVDGALTLNARTGDESMDSGPH